jgi:hypothetical protein
MSGQNKHADLVARATQRLAVLKARQLLREMKAQKRTREVARRQTLQRRMELGHATSMAGVDDYSADEVVGMLLDAKERMGHSPTQRLALRKRGEEWLKQAALQTAGHGSSQ